MKTLLKVELKKIIYNRVFWVTLGLYFLTFIGFILIVNGIINNLNTISSNASGMNVLPTDIFGFPEIYHNMGFIAKYVKILMAVVMIILVTNEYTYKTLRQNIITGLNRLDIVLAKLYVAFGLSLLASLILFLFSFISGLVSTEYMYFWKVVDKIYIIPLYFLMMFSFLTFAIMISFLLRKTGLSLISLIFYSYILEPIFAFKFEDSFGQYLPLNQINKLIGFPENNFSEFLKIQNNDVPQSMESIVLIVIFYSALFSFISYMIVKKRDL